MLGHRRVKIFTHKLAAEEDHEVSHTVVFRFYQFAQPLGSEIVSFSTISMFITWHPFWSSTCKSNFRLTVDRNSRLFSFALLRFAIGLKNSRLFRPIRAVWGVSCGRIYFLEFVRDAISRASRQLDQGAILQAACLDVQSTLSLRTPRYYGQNSDPRRINDSRYCGLSLLRNYGHFL